MTRPCLREITAKDAHTFSAGTADGECGAMTGASIDAMLLERVEARSDPCLRRSGGEDARHLGAHLRAPRPRHAAGGEDWLEAVVCTGGS